MALALPDIHAAAKLLTAADWVDRGGGRVSLVAALEIGGATIEGLFLRATARRALADREVMFQVEYRPSFGAEEQLCRINWRPIRPHHNHGRGPEEHRFREIAGSHHHSFEANWVADENRMRSGNLPIAIPVSPDPSDFRQLVALVTKEFRINNLGGISVPPWDLML